MRKNSAKFAVTTPPFDGGFQLVLLRAFSRSRLCFIFKFCNRSRIQAHGVELALIQTEFNIDPWGSK